MLVAKETRDALIVNSVSNLVAPEQVVPHSNSIDSIEQEAEWINWVDQMDSEGIETVAEHLIIPIDPAPNGHELDGNTNRKSNGNPNSYRSLFKGSRDLADSRDNFWFFVCDKRIYKIMNHMIFRMMYEFFIFFKLIVFKLEVQL